MPITLKWGKCRNDAAGSCVDAALRHDYSRGGSPGAFKVITKISTLVPTVRVQRMRLPSAEKLGLVQEPVPSIPLPKVTRVGFDPPAAAS